MEYLIKYLGAGKIEKDSRNQVVFLRFTKISEITQIIIPFLKKFPIHGVKQLDFQDWCKVANLMNEKKHLTTEGLNLIRSIKSGMNTRRNFD